MNWARVFFGALIVAVGGVLLLEFGGMVDAGEVFSAWWPVAIVVAGGLGIASNPRRWIFPAIVMAFGGALLLRTTEVVDTLELVLPLLLVVAGLAVIFGKSIGQPRSETSDTINSFNLFSGSEVASHSTQFRGGNVGALFGGTEIDLRDSNPAPGAELDVFVAFGGAEVRVPEGWEVTTKGFPIFGGFDNVTSKEQLPADAPHLDINATVLFGGLEVKH